MQVTNLYERLTFRYALGWSHLDNERFVATVKSTPFRLVREGNYHDDLGTYLAHVRAPRGAPNLIEAIRDSFGGSGCRHEYDCCGCRSRFVQVKKVSARGYVLRVSVSRNY